MAHPDEPPRGTWVIGDLRDAYQRSRYDDPHHHAHWWSLHTRDWITWRAICTYHHRVEVVALLQPIKKED